MYGRGFGDIMAMALGRMDPDAMQLAEAFGRPPLVFASGKKGAPRPPAPQPAPIDWERVLIDRILRDIRDPRIIPGRYE